MTFILLCVTSALAKNHLQSLCELITMHQRLSQNCNLQTPHPQSQHHLHFIC